MGQRRFKQIGGEFPSGDIVCPDVAEPFASFCIAVHADQKRFGGDGIQKFRLAIGVNWADGDTVNAAGHQIADDLLLFGNRTGRDSVEIYLDPAEVLCDEVATSLCARPKIAGIVADKAQRYLLLRRAI